MLSTVVSSLVWNSLPLRGLGELSFRLAWLEPSSVIWTQALSKMENFDMSAAPWCPCRGGEEEKALPRCPSRLDRKQWHHCWLVSGSLTEPDSASWQYWVLRLQHLATYIESKGKEGTFFLFPHDLRRELSNNISYIKNKNYLDQANTIRLELFYSQLCLGSFLLSYRGQNEGRRGRRKIAQSKIASYLTSVK